MPVPTLLSNSFAVPDELRVLGAQQSVGGYYRFSLAFAGGANGDAVIIWGSNDDNFAQVRVGVLEYGDILDVPASLGLGSLIAERIAGRSTGASIRVCGPSLVSSDTNPAVRRPDAGDLQVPDDTGDVSAWVNDIVAAPGADTIYFTRVAFQPGDAVAIEVSLVDPPQPQAIVGILSDKESVQAPCNFMYHRVRRVAGVLNPIAGPPYVRMGSQPFGPFISSPDAPTLPAVAAATYDGVNQNLITGAQYVTVQKLGVGSYAFATLGSAAPIYAVVSLMSGSGNVAVRAQVQFNFGGGGTFSVATYDSAGAFTDAVFSLVAFAGP